MQTITETQSDRTPLCELMHRLAREMRIAASTADDCQDALADDARLEINPDTAMRLQGLDLLSQQLIEIGRLLDRLACEGVTGYAPAQLLADVRLSELRQRLESAHEQGVRVFDSELW